MQKILEKHQIWIRVILVMLIISISFGYCQAEGQEKVYYFSYGHLTDNLEHIAYNEQNNQYTVHDTDPSITCNFGMEVKSVKFLYLDLNTSTDQPTNWRLEYLNTAGEQTAEQDVVLKEGNNKVKLDTGALGQLRLVPELETGETFELKNVELRSSSKDFYAKKYIVCCGISFLAMAVLVFVWMKKGPVEKVKSLLGEMQNNIDEFLKVLAETITWKFTYRIRRLLRSVLFLVIMVYITYIQHKGVDDLVTYSSMHMWVVGGILLLLTGLIYENRPYEKTDRSWLKFLLMLYLAFVWISDFYLNKKFRYAGFGIVFFGGFFARAWRSMEHPDELMDDFKLGYKFYFLLGSMLCLAFRPVTAGVCYSGFFTEASGFGIMMLLALVVFISDWLIFPKYIWNGAGALMSLYFIWLTQKLTIVLIAGLVIIAGAIFSIADWIKAQRSDKIRRLILTGATAVLGIVCVLVLKKVLGVLPYKLGMQKSFTADVIESYDLRLLDMIRQGRWEVYFHDKIQICKTYLQNTNFWGHNNLTKYFDVTVWPANSIVMNTFRYGMAAGIAYGMMIIVYAGKAIANGIRKNSFRVVAFAMVGILVAMVEVTERPFCDIGWYLLGFGMCDLLAIKK